MRHIHIRRLFCFALALALLFAASAAAEAFSFRNGVTWSTTPAQMLAAEGLGDSGVNKHDDNGYTYYYLKGQNVYYVFRGEQLVQAYTVLSADAYAAELERQSALLGAPADVSEDSVAALLNQLIPNSAMPGELSAHAAWRLSDGTLVALFILNGKPYLSYFNEQLL